MLGIILDTEVGKMKFGEISRDEWESFGQNEGNYVQSIEMQGFYEKRGLTTYLVGIKEEGRVTAKGLLVGRGGDFWMGDGPIMDFKDLARVKFFMEGLVGYATEKGMTRVEVFPEAVWTVRNDNGEVLREEKTAGLFKAMEGAGFSYNGRLTSNRAQGRANRWVFVKNLDGIKSVDELRMTYEYNTRRKVKRNCDNLEIVRVGREELGVVKGLVDESGRKHEVEKPDLRYYEEFYDSLGEHAWFMVAREKESKEAVAGGIFIVYGGEMYYFMAGSSQKHLKSEGMRVLQDHMIWQAIQEGCSRYNFLGVEGHFENNPLLMFKAEFGGEVIEYVGGFRKVMRPGKYLAHKGLSKVRRVIRNKRH